MYTASINGIEISIKSSPELFSPDGLDRGTAAMLSLAKLPDGLILDLGCGCGPVGIYAAKCRGEENVVMCDVSERAVGISRENAARNGVKGVKIYCCDGLGGISESGFSLILSNPPYHADFSVAKRFIEDGFKRLKPGGEMMMVTKRLEWYKNKFTSVFGGVKVVERDGYYVFSAQKRETSPKKKTPPRGLSKKLERKYKKRADKPAQ